MIITRNRLVTTADIEDRAVTRAKLSFDTLWKVARVDVTSDVTQVDFTGLDGDSDGLYVLVCYINNGSSSAANYGLRFNDDTGTNYTYVYLYGNGSSVSTDVDSLSYLYLGYLAAGSRAFKVYWIYPKTGQLRYVTGHHVDTNHRAWHIGGWWTNTTDNLVKISIVASATGAISAGSWFILYKLGI